MTSLLPDRNKLRVFAASLKDLGGHAAEAFDRTLSEMHLRLDAWRDSGIEKIMAVFGRDAEEIGRIAARSERFGKPIGKKSTGWSHTGMPGSDSAGIPNPNN